MLAAGLSLLEARELVSLIVAGAGGRRIVQA